MFLQPFKRCRPLATACFLMLGTPVFAQALLPVELPPNVVARRGGVDLTVHDIDVKLRTIPPDLRAGYMTESDRATRMIDATLLSKQLAARARELKLDQRADFNAELDLLRTELLSRYAIEQHMAEAPLPNVDALAYERYLANPDAVKPGPRIDVSQILIATDGKDEAAAKTLALEALAKAKAGADFVELAREYSGDKDANPSIQNVDFTRMDPEFSKAVAELEKPGDIIGPVRSQFGYHVIRLDVYQAFPVPSFEKVKEQLILELQGAAKDKIKNDFLGSFSKLPTELNDATILRLRDRYVKGGEADANLPLKVDAPAGN